MNFTRLFRTALPALAGGSAFAHPGHHASTTLGFIEGLVHLLTEPDHLGMLAVGVATAVVVLRRLRAPRRGGSQRPDPLR
jgi:hydrogenase/urease accessory protein HupE